MERSNAVTIYRNGIGLPIQPAAALPVVATPVADVVETDAAFILRLDLPGAARESIRLAVERGSLTITADLRTAIKEASRTVHREILWNRFERRFNLGTGINEERITAEVQHGVLTVHVPKSDAVRPREIPVR
jgi:HSP20 family protein